MEVFRGLESGVWNPESGIRNLESFHDRSLQLPVL